MSDIKFSVVIPLYNKEQSIVNTVFSVLKQSYQNFEIVIINDGSSDGSVDAVKTIRDERIRLIYQENQGVSAARNLGIKEASYEWIAFLDGDDLWEPNHLKEIIKMMNTFPNEKVFVTSFEYSDKRKIFKHEGNDPIFKIENYFKEAIKDDIMWTSIVVVHKDCFLAVKGFNEKLKYGEDLDLWARLALHYTIVKSSNITAIYRLDAENRTSGYQELNFCLDYNIEWEKIKRKDIYNYFCFLINRRLFSYLISLNFKDFVKLRWRKKFSGLLFYIFLRIKAKYK